MAENVTCGAAMLNSYDKIGRKTAFGSVGKGKVNVLFVVQKLPRLQ